MTRLGRWSNLIGGLLAGGPLVVLDFPFRGYAGIAVVGGFTLSAIWFFFVAWRVVRLTRARSAKMDREYDRKHKFDLPPEYAGTESATKARFRRRKRP